MNCGAPLFTWFCFPTDPKQLDEVSIIILQRAAVGAVRGRRLSLCLENEQAFKVRKATKARRALVDVGVKGLLRLGEN